MKGAYKIMIGLLVVILAVIVVAALGMIPGHGNLFNVSQTPQPSNTVNVQGTCPNDASLSFTANVFDENPLNQATSRNADYNLVYYENGGYIGSTSPGTAITGIPINTHLDLYFIDKTAAGTTAYNFSAAGKEVLQNPNLPFDPVNNKHVSGGYDISCTNRSDNLFKGARDGALTLSMYDNTLTQFVTSNSGAAATAVGAGGNANFGIVGKLNTANTRFSTSEAGGKVLLVIDYNALAYKQPTVTAVTGGSVGSANEVGVPATYSNVATDSTARVTYVITTSNLMNLQSIRVEGQLQALTATTNPTVGADGNVGFSFYDAQMYQKLNGSWDTAFVNADTGADIGQANSTATFYTS